jgi:cold shock CspA family protein
MPEAQNETPHRRQQRGSVKSGMSHAGSLFMIVPVQVTFRNVVAMTEIEDKIRKSAQMLEKFCSHITSCRVMVEAPARHREKGYLFHVRIDLTLPDREIIVKREPTLHARERVLADERRRKGQETRPERKHLEVAIREAFHTARRRLQDHARQVRLDVKTHESMQQGRVSKLLPIQGHGYIETQDGREIYFHANSVLNKCFKNLKVGSKVKFTEEAGEKGPQASTVHVVRSSQSASEPLPVVRRARAKRKTA